MDNIDENHQKHQTYVQIIIKKLKKSVILQAAEKKKKNKKLEILNRKLTSPRSDTTFPSCSGCFLKKKKGRVSRSSAGRPIPAQSVLPPFADWMPMVILVAAAAETMICLL
ncbi:unnamed protein product [Camellia sinensis]